MTLSESAATVYAVLIERVASLGVFDLDENASSRHLKRRVAFAGVHSRRAGLLLTIVSVAPIESARFAKAERVSKNRTHNEILLATPEAVDDELLGWLAEAYALAG